MSGGGSDLLWTLESFCGLMGNETRAWRGGREGLGQQLGGEARPELDQGLRGLRWGDGEMEAEGPGHGDY